MGSRSRRVNAALLGWVAEQINHGAAASECAAAVARTLADQRGLPVADAPELLRRGALAIPESVDLSAIEPVHVGQVYEHGLEAGVRHRQGAHYTPMMVAEGLAKIALVGVESGPILDPSVGGAAFLLAAGEVLVDQGYDRGPIVEEMLWGIDIDPEAVAVAEAVLALWGSDGLWRSPADHLVVADALEVGCEAFAQAPAEGFVAVLGNPPFQGQLGAGTARDAAANAKLRDRWQTTAGPYADTAAYFLLMAKDAVGPRGVVALVQPTSTLSSNDSQPIRRELDAAMTLSGLWFGGRGVFSAEVDVCAPILTNEVAAEGANTKVRRWERASFDRAEPVDRQATDDWSALNTELVGVPKPKLRGDALRTRCTATAGFRDQFYGIAPHVLEAADVADGRRVAPLVTVGMIDPLLNRTGEAKFRYAGAPWTAPVVDLDALEAENPTLARWTTDRLRPKVLVATQTKVLEVLPDVEGTLVPSTPVVSVECHADDVWLLTAALCAPALTAISFARSAGAALSAGRLKLSASQLLDLALPTEQAAWAEGAEIAKRAFAAPTESERIALLLELAETMDRAYDVVDFAIAPWWATRLARKR